MSLQWWDHILTEIDHWSTEKLGMIFQHLHLPKHRFCISEVFLFRQEECPPFWIWWFSDTERFCSSCWESPDNLITLFLFFWPMLECSIHCKFFYYQKYNFSLCSNFQNTVLMFYFLLTSFLGCIAVSISPVHLDLENEQWLDLVVVIFFLNNKWWSDPV